MKGVQFVVNEDGDKTAAVIDLKQHSGILEHFFDVAVAKSRRGEPRESLDAVKR
jgi:hypothetical protein